MKWMVIVLLVLVGCHGSELRVGTGHAFNDFSGTSSMSSGGGHGNPKNHGGESSDLSFDQDDTTSVYAELAFQLTPQSVVIQNQPASFAAPERFYPFGEPAPPVQESESEPPVPEPEPPVLDVDPFARCEKILRQGLEGVNGRLDGLDVRLAAMEEETSDHISWTDIGVGGGTAGSGLGLLWLAFLYWKKKTISAE